jgi:Cu/Ag efflux protein CusF
LAPITLLRRAILPAVGVVLLVVGALLAACQSKTPNQAQQKRYQLKGTVISANPEAKQILVNGEEIRGFMDAMTMPYTVKDARLLEGIGFGDRITADVVVEGDQFWLESIIVVKPEASPATPAPGAFHTPMHSEAGTRLLAQVPRKVEVFSF